jgi:hypothetical protein
MGVVFHPAVLTGERRILNLVDARQIRRLAADPATYRIASPAAERTINVRGA